MLISTAVYIYFKSFASAAASFLTGVFLDIDHILDYFITYGLRFDLKEFYNSCEEIKLKRLMLVFHSYELLVILWVSIFIFSLGNIWKAVAIGFTHHIIIDQLVNTPIYGLDTLGYFFVFRMINRFDRDNIVKRR